MVLHLSDLDELCQKVRNIHSKKYLEEAIASYRTGAYRAAIITTWVGVCVDIIEKIRELSLSGDHLAKNIEDRLKNIQPDKINEMLAFEREIIDIAYSQLELISIIEKTHLERLREDRNLCAHPTFSIDGVQFNPLPELTRSYIVHAANYLLINPPVKGKFIVDRLFELVNEESFPEDDEKAYLILSSDIYLGKVKESSIRNFTIILFKRLFKDEEGIGYQQLNRISAALGVIERINPKTYNEIINSTLNKLLAETNDKQLKRIFPFLLKRKNVWSKIHKGIITRIEELISVMNVEELSNYRVLQLASINSSIEKAVISIIEKYDSNKIYNLIKISPSLLLKKHAIDKFINSSSFNSAYKNGIELIIPHAGFFNDCDLEIILNGILANQSYNINQILNASHIDDVFAELYKKTKEHVSNHGFQWKSFYDNIKAFGNSYPNLKELLTSDKLIDVESVEIKNEYDDMPF